MVKKLFLFSLFLISNRLAGQVYEAIGYSGASFNTPSSGAGGFCLYLGRNILGAGSSSFSASTNIRLGIEDKIASGLILPAILLLSNNGSNNPSDGGGNGGTVHLFTEIPLLFHYNFGLGSTEQNQSPAGFYIGGGINFVATGYTDTAGYSRPTSFFGGVVDGGIRFNKIMDLNFEMSVPINRSIGQIRNPTFYEVSLLITIKPVIY